MLSGRSNRGDRFFTQEQHERLVDFRARKSALSPEEEAERERLVAESFDATIARTGSLQPAKQ